MKKFTSLATALCLASAFCGLCAGCAKTIEAEGAGRLGATEQEVSVSSSTEYKVILNPGWYYSGGSKKLNTVGAGATQLTNTGTNSEADLYNVENGYFANVEAGQALPSAVTTRADTTFVGWTYTENGEVVVMEKMPKTLLEDLYLYASWNVKGTTIDGGDEVVGPDNPVDVGVTVNGYAMSKNIQASSTEYMLIGKAFEAGDVLEFKNNGVAITLKSVEGSSTGVAYSSGKAVITESGTFDLYLKSDGTNWTLYGKREVQASEIERYGDTMVYGNCYLVGNIKGTDVSWDTSATKGFRATLSGSNYTLTVKLTQGDNVKFRYFYSAASGEWWSSQLASGSDSSAIVNENSNDKNLVIQKTATYTFTVSNSGSHTITFTYQE